MRTVKTEDLICNKCYKVGGIKKYVIYEVMETSSFLIEVDDGCILERGMSWEIDDGFCYSGDEGGYKCCECQSEVNIKEVVEWNYEQELIKQLSGIGEK